MTNDSESRFDRYLKQMVQDPYPQRLDGNAFSMTEGEGSPEKAAQLAPRMKLRTCG